MVVPVWARDLRASLGSALDSASCSWGMALLVSVWGCFCSPTVDPLRVGLAREAWGHRAGCVCACDSGWMPGT